MATEPRQPFLRSLSAEIVALALLVPLAIVLGAVLTRFPPLPPSPASSAPPPVVSPLLPSLAPEALSPAGPPPSPTPPRESPAKTVALAVHASGLSREFRIPVEGETTVASLLERASREFGLRLTTKDFGGSLGIFVESLEGIANDATTEHYWTLYVNEKFSPVGASSARVQPGDTVRWAYEPMHAEE